MASDRATFSSAHASVLELGGAGLTLSRNGSGRDDRQYDDRQQQSGREGHLGTHVCSVGLWPYRP